MFNEPEGINRFAKPVSGSSPKLVPDLADKVIMLGSLNITMQL